MKKNKVLVKAVSTLVLAFALASCQESKQLQEIRPLVINDILDDSCEKANMGPVNSSEAQYKERLKQVLEYVPTEDMLLFRKNKVSVLLDQRLGSQKTGFFDTTMIGVYYPSENVLTIWDDGKQPNDGIFGNNRSSWGDDAMEEFAAGVRSKGGWFADKKINIREDFVIAKTYTITTSTGKGSTTTTHCDWFDKSDFDKDTIKKNPDIIRSAPSK